MAEGKLDVSLDELIKRQATKGPSKGRAGAKPGSGRGVKLGVAKGRGGGVTKATARSAKQAPLATGGGGGGRRGGGSGGVITIRNPRSAGPRAAASAPRGGGGPPRGGFGGGGNGAAPRRRMDPPPAGKWRHDLYDPHQPGADVVVGSGGGGGGGRSVIKNKLFVSNLADHVTDQDIVELFQSQGPIKDAGVHYDRSGRSKGTAHVVYERAGDAMKAFTKYNNVALDGKRLSIELVETAVPAGTIAKLSSGINVSTVAGGGGGGGRSAAFGANRPRSVVRGRGAPRAGDADAMQE